MSDFEEAALYFETGIFSGCGFFSNELDLRTDSEIMDQLQKVKQYPD